MAMTVVKTNTLLEIEDLHLSFGGVNVLNGINLSVQRGDIFSIIGPNGAGKTSLLNCINMHYRPKHGGITFDGKSTRKKSTLFFHFFLTTLSLSGLNRFFLSFIEPELATAIISFLKPGVAGGKTLSIVSEIGNLV